MTNFPIHADEEFLDALSASWIMAFFSPKPPAQPARPTE